MARRRSQATPVDRSSGPVSERARASSADEVADTLGPLAEDGWPVRSSSYSSSRGRMVSQMTVDVVLPPVGQVGGRAPGPDEVVVHAQPGGLLEEGQDHLPLAEAVDHHRRRREVHAVGGHPHQMGGDPVELGQEHPDPVGAGRHLDAEERLDGKREDQLVVERRQVVHAGDVGGPLDVGQLLGGLLHAGVEVADHRLGPQHRLAVELDHEPEHAVGRRVLGAHVDDHGLVVGLLDVDVVGVDHHALGQAQHGTRLAAQLVGLGLLAGEELLGALGRLADQAALDAGVGGLGVGQAGNRVGQHRVGVGHAVAGIGRRGVAHRGPGAPLNWTGTRPTP